MKDQFRRFSSAMPRFTQGRVTAAGVSQQAVPDFQSSMRGLNPMAGDMTGAFQKFFGSLNESAQSIVDTQNRIEIQREKDINKFAALAGEVAGQRVVNDPANKDKSPTELVALNPDRFDYKGESITGRRSFSEEFSKAVGRQTGTAAFLQFQSYLDENQIPLEQAEAEKDKWWTANFGEGTGNPHHDLYAQTTWANNIEQWSFDTQKQLTAQSRERLQTTANRNVARLFDTPTFGLKEMAEANAIIAKAFPNLSVGQVQSHVVGKMLDTAYKKPALAHRAIQLMNEPPEINDDGELGQSFRERFPNEYQKHAAVLKQRSDQHITHEGARAVAAVDAKVASIGAMPSETIAEFNAKYQALINAGLDIGLLNNTSGVGGKNVKKLSAKITEIFTDLGIKQTNANIMRRAMFGAGPPLLPQTDASLEGMGANEDFEKRAQEIARRNVPSSRLPSWMTPEQRNNAWNQETSSLDPLGNDDDAAKYGQAGRNLYLGNGGWIAEEFTNTMYQGINSKDVNQIKRAIKILAIVDEKGEWYAAKHFKKDPLTLLKYEAYSIPGAQLQEKIDLFSSDDFQAAVKDFSLERLVKAEDSDVKSKDDINAWLNKNFYGDGEYSKTMGELVLNNNYRLSKDPVLSPAVKAAVPAIARVVYATHLVQNRELGIKDLREEVAKYLRKITVPGIDDNPEFADATPFDPSIPDEANRRKVRWGLHVVNPLGKVENTIANTRRAVDEITSTGITGLRTDGEIPDLYTIPSDTIAGPARLIMDRNTSGPYILPIGVPFQTQNVYDEDGERYQLADQFNLFSPGFKNVDVKFTGEAAADKEIASRFLHKSITLHPFVRGGELLGYSMSIMPHFRQLSPSDEDLIQQALNPGPLVSPPVSGVAQPVERPLAAATAEQRLEDANQREQRRLEQMRRLNDEGLN